MPLLEAVKSDVTTALKAGDRERVTALRMVVSELQKAAKEGSADGEEQVLQRERKRRLESARAYRDAGREDLAVVEEREAALIEGYLPDQLTDDELQAIVAAAVAESGASSVRDMGKAMALVLPKVGGRADGRRVSEAVKGLLAA